MKIITIGAHSDDNEIGMGASLNKFSKLGHEVTIIDLILPGENNKGKFDIANKNKRKVEAKNAAKVLECNKKILDFEQSDYNFERKYIQEVDHVINNLEPDIVFMNWVGDSHQDHWVTAKIVMACARKNKFSLMMYEQMTPGGITNNHFKAQYFVDVSDFIDKKIESLNCYESQKLMYGDWSESIKARAKLRGYQISVDYAECFEVVKIIENKIV